MQGMESVHKAVLLHEVTQGVIPAKAGIQDQVDNRICKTLDSRFRGNDKIWYLDGTLGGCGHALAIVKALKGEVNIVGLDRDKGAIERADKLFEGETGGKVMTGKIILECEDYRNLDKVLDKHGIKAVNMILLDLGLSSDELENSGRGFSFQKYEPLLMTMGDPADYPFTARDILNRWTEEDIANVIYGYGEERFARRIARAICGYREKKKIETSGELCEIVRTSVPAFYRRGTTSSLVDSGLRSAGKRHPATKTFQALRIAVNDELGALKEGLAKGYGHLANGGKMAVISFHSLEDAIVKKFYKEKAKEEGAVITKKPIVAGPQELAENPRSRSAKLRVIQKTF